MNSDYHMKSEIVLLPITERKSLFLTYSDDFTSLLNNMIRDESDFVKKYAIEEYYYQNQTDRPEKISSSDWNKRKNDWNKVFKNGIPSIDGISITLTDANYINLTTVIPDKNIIVENFTPKDKRVTRFAYDMVASVYLKEQVKDTSNLSDSMRALREFKEIVKDKKSQWYKKIEAEKKRLNKNIPELDLDILNKKVVDFIPNYMKHLNSK